MNKRGAIWRAKHPKIKHPRIVRKIIDGTLGCPHCKETKAVELFDPRTDSPTGRDYWCTECRRQDANARYHTGRKETQQRYYQQHKAERIAYSKAYAKKHRKVISINALAKYHAELKSNIKNRLMVRLSQSLRGSKKSPHKWHTLLGYNTLQLKDHLEKQFIDGMCWENKGDWHIDHIIPISAFNFHTIEDIDFKKCWALDNLRPMWAKDNIKKRDKLAQPFQPSLALAV